MSSGRGPPPDGTRRRGSPSAQQPEPSPPTRTEGETIDLPDRLGAFTRGQVLGERYEILEMLGRGGMGEVWSAFDLKLRVQVALKALREDLFRSERRIELLRQEVRAAREVVSPNVCRIFDLIEIEGRELVSMEYVDGATLLGVLQERGPLDLKEAQDIASQFLAGLEAIHKVGLVHRDIKPENIMLTRAGRVVVMDFGLARQETEGGGSVSGTPAYMAPEQAAGQPLDARADVYSAGVVLAEMVSPDGIKSLESRQSLWEGVRSEPARLPDSPWAPVLKRAVARDREARFNTAHTLTRALEDVTLRVEGAEDLHPYPGLASFSEQDAEYFFGREAEVEQMWRKLEGPPRMLALVGPSGAGKSSFVRAGLFAAAPAGWSCVVCHPGNAATSSLGRVMARATAGDPDVAEMLMDFENPDVAVEVLSRWRHRGDRALLVVDQFEELFTQNAPDEQRRFAELLARVVLAADVRVLLSMRDDFLLRCHDHDALASLFSGLSPLAAPVGGALRRALVRPATKCGYRFEDDELVEEMLDEVAGERGALPLLAFAAAQLWESRDRETGLLTREAFHDIGGVAGALARHAEATIDRIGAGRIGIVRELFRNLVTAEGTRAVREWHELLSVFDEAQRRPAQEVLHELIDARLLTSYEVREEDSEPTRRVEIIHESLLANWPRLVRWQTQDADAMQLRDQLRQAARTWDDRKRPADLLWTGTAYREYALWRERYQGGLSGLEEEFARAMRTHDRRRKRRRRIAVTAAFVLLLAVLAVVGVAWQQAVAAANRAEAQKLLALGQLELEAEPAAALAFARASLEMADTYEGRLFALRALQTGPVARFVQPFDEGPVRGVSFSADGEWCVVGSEGAFVVYHRSGGDPVFEGGDGSPFFFTDGRGMGIYLDNEIRIYSVPEFTETARQPLDVDEDQLRRLIPTSRGLMFLVDVGNAWEIALWPVTSPPESLTTIPNPRTTHWDPEGEWIAYIAEGDEHRVRLQSLVEPIAPPRLIHTSDNPIADITLLHGLGLLSVLEVGSDTHELWPINDAVEEPLRTIEGHGLNNRTDHSGTRLVEIGPHDGIPAAFVHDLRTPIGAEPLVVRSRSRGENIDVGGVDPSGRWLAVGNIGAAILWPLPVNPPLVLPGDGALTADLAFTMDSKNLVIPSSGGVRLQPIEGGGSARRLLRPWQGQRDMRFWPGQVAMDPRGRFAMLSAVAPMAAVICPLDGSKPTRLEFDSPRTGRALRLAYDPERELVAIGVFNSAAEDKVIGVWDLRNGSQRVLGPTEDAGNEYDGGYSGLDFLPDGSLVSASKGGGVRRWNLEDGTSEVLLAGFIWGMDVASDGRTAVVAFGGASGDTGQVILDLATREVRPLEGFHGDIYGWAFSPRGDVFAVANHNGDIQIGRLSGGELYYLFGHETLIGGMAFSPDGRLFAAVDQRGTALRVWTLPDMSKPPFQALPYDELMAKLDSFTNLRVVRDEASPTGWKQAIGPFQGWETAPEW